MRADLHSHTTASDGTFTPRQVVERAKAKGLAVLSITDHDTVAGLSEAQAAGMEHGIEIVPGIEISSIYKGRDVHVLGYYMNIADEVFLARLTELRDVRQLRNKMIIARLAELNIHITLAEVAARKKETVGNVGRPHIAEVLIEKGIVSSMEEAFTRYLGSTGAAYVNPPRITPEEAIDLIHAAGGVAVLAHPGLYKNPELVRTLIVHGLDGIEVYHPDNNTEDEVLYSALADEAGISKTSGSDFHGMRSGVVFHADLGDRSAPLTTVQELRQRAEKRQAAV
ncbi:hypothetical protein DFP93_102311 [Aneurinibacillus soli]|uniref:Uncharacterized protein n=1 Tax=Aneurinibacillus soli TaxID=1500254 RepID=A0A0U5C680_9BACL|nr:PHP domain-containing protein [Aneurinibacillus soli]PYE63624.1 hypothetical protein DFP93_102311 [Aneurinibacillus soli]BAU27443.1 hypothetical protein CB4_01617 [Aneurinibacillus soli]